jgi:hypothetical protein
MEACNAEDDPLGSLWKETVMTSGVQDLVGCDAYSREGDKIGKVKEVISDPESVSECIVIKYGMFRDLVVPVDVIQREGVSVTIPFTHTSLNSAPRVAKKGSLSPQDRAQLQDFYHGAAV